MGTAQSITLVFPNNIYGQIMSYCDGRHVAVSDYIKGLIRDDMEHGGGGRPEPVLHRGGGSTQFVEGMVMTGMGHGI